jgi:hypothetical protein
MDIALEWDARKYASQENPAEGTGEADEAGRRLANLAADDKSPVQGAPPAANEAPLENKND